MTFIFAPTYNMARLYAKERNIEKKEWKYVEDITSVMGIKMPFNVIVLALPDQALSRAQANALSHLAYIGMMG